MISTCIYASINYNNIICKAYKYFYILTSSKVPLRGQVGSSVEIARHIVAAVHPQFYRRGSFVARVVRCSLQGQREAKRDDDVCCDVKKKKKQETHICEMSDTRFPKNWQKKQTQSEIYVKKYLPHAEVFIVIIMLLHEKNER